MNVIKFVIPLIVCIFLSTFVLATAQITSTIVNVSIENHGCIIYNGTENTTATSNTTITLRGEQNSLLSRSVGNNQSISDNLQIYMIRDFVCEEEQQLSNTTKKMINLLDFQLNYFDKWVQCNISMEKRKLIEDEFQYRENYTECKNDLENKDEKINDYSSKLTNAETETQKMASQRIYYLIGGVGVASLVCYNMWKKKKGFGSEPERKGMTGAEEG